MRYALGLEYDGSAFSGWQRLDRPDGPAKRAEATVQAALEAALSSVAGHRVDTTCAGRTDAGVHAACQVVHFDSDAAREPRSWVLGATSRLPADASVLWCVPVDAGFHARFSARARRYRYRILNRPVRPALQRQYLTWERRPLDADAMHRAAQALVGEHDFSAFRTVHCQAPHARRNLHRIAVRREGDLVEIEVQANAFLHHMVRNIVGSLLPVGRGDAPEGWLAELLAGRDRTVAGPTAPSPGLAFTGPLYPSCWNLPAMVSDAGTEGGSPMIPIQERRTLFRTRVKFCGMTRPGDVRLASELGVDAVGFVFAPGSPRRVHPQQARLMRLALGPLVDAVALFMDNSVDEVRKAVGLVRPTLLQFHGREDDAFCRGFGVPYIKAIPMGGEAPTAAMLRARYPGAAGFLFDAHAPGAAGGTGQRFDLARLPADLQAPMLLAGGLDPGNVFEAITTALPWGVDVSSGIETAPGIKDGERMQRFVEEVRRADCHVEAG